MIRRRVQCGFVLIAQQQVALCAAELLRQTGGAFAPSADPPSTLLAAEHAFDGFADLDAAVPISARGVPMRMDELSVLDQLQAWEKTTRLAQDLPPRSATLLGLLALQWSARPELHRGESLRELFGFNRQQHMELERLEHHRPILGLRNDIPTHYGLPDKTVTPTPAEAALLRDLSLLHMVLELSAEACSHSILTRCIGYFAPAIGADVLPLHTRWIDEQHLGVTRWPFLPDRLSLNIRQQVVPPRRYATAEELHKALADSPAVDSPLQLVKDD